jgi:transposase
VEDWALVRRPVADRVPQRQVARDLGIGRSTVERALASDRPSRYERPAVPTAFTPFEPLVVALLRTTPDMPATVIAERVGWTGSITWFRDNVRRLRPEHRPVDPAGRLTWLPGDAAQVRPAVPAAQDPA